MKQKIERLYFEQFGVHYPLPLGDIQYGDKPDVIINGPASVGIEIARLYKLDGKEPHSEQQQSRDRMRVLKLAEDAHLAAGGRSIEINVGFNPRHPIKRERLRSISAVLADIVSEIARYEEPCTLHSPAEDWPELEFIYHSGQSQRDSSWKLVQSIEIPALSFERINEIVKQKIEKVKAYQPCDKYWLLLIVDYWDAAQDQDVEWPPAATIAQTPFERILIFKTVFSIVTEVIQR
nr:hypothetical protein [uncultured Pseudomonas sp.]